MAAAIYATPGIEETQKLPTLEAAIVLTTVCTGLLMTFLGHRKLGNIVRLLPSPVTGGFLAGTGWVLTAGAFKVLSGGLPLSFENLNQFFLLGGDKSYEQLMFVTGPGVLLANLSRGQPQDREVLGRPRVFVRWGFGLLQVRPCAFPKSGTPTFYLPAGDCGGPITGDCLLTHVTKD